MDGEQYYERAQMLFQQQRYAEAEKMARQLLKAEPNNGVGLLLLGQIQLAQHHLEAAQDSIQRAIGVAPDNGDAHYLLAAIRAEQQDYKAAITSIREATRLDPSDADYYSLHAQILLLTKDYQQALEKAEEGLRVQGDHLDSLNMRSQALVKLGHKEAAFKTVETALEQDPENPWTHANYGWIELEKGDARKALGHFQEALRLDPHNGSARSGMIEALKARYLVYRWWLAYAFWLGNLGNKAQWAVIIGFWLGARMIRAIGRSNPELLPYTTPLIVAYAVFAITTWTMNPLSNLFLRLNRFGRYLLDKHELLASNLVGISLLLAGIGGIGYGVTSTGVPLFDFLNGTGGWMALMVFGVTMMVPISGALGNKRKKASWLQWYTLGLAFVGGLATVQAFATGELFSALATVYILGWVAFTWIANFANS